MVVCSSWSAKTMARSPAELLKACGQIVRSAVWLADCPPLVASQPDEGIEG